MSQNPLTVTLPKFAYATATAVSHAAYFHRVTVSEGGKPANVFSGTGEGAAMRLADGLAELQLGGSRHSSVAVTLLFEFSPQGGGGPFSPSRNVVVTHLEHLGQTVLSVTAQDSAKEPGGGDIDVLVNIRYSIL